MRKMRKVVRPKGQPRRAFTKEPTSAAHVVLWQTRKEGNGEHGSGAGKCGGGVGKCGVGKCGAGERGAGECERT